MGEKCDGRWNKGVGEEADDGGKSTREEDERKADEETKQSRETDGSEEGGGGVYNGSLNNLSRGRCWAGETVKVPLTDGGGGHSALDTGDDSDGPEVDEHKERPEPPTAQIDDERSGPRQVTAKEDPSEHEHPDPRPGDHAGQNDEPKSQKLRVGSEDPTRELENADGFAD